MNLEKLLQKNPFKIKKKIKYDFFNNMIKDLTFHHYKFCEEYKCFIIPLFVFEGIPVLISFIIF